MGRGMVVSGIGGKDGVWMGEGLCLRKEELYP